MLHLSASPSPARTGSLMLLAPLASAVPDAFHGVNLDPAQHAQMLWGVQKLRGSVYLRDGAIDASQLTPEGLHVQVSDETSWHVISVQPDGDVVACARYRPHHTHAAPESLGVWSSALARSEAWSARLRSAIEQDMTLARVREIAFAEVGGWAVAEQWRGTTQAASTALSTYALAESLGGAIGITTATVRHCSSRILRKLGGRSLECAGDVMPSYFDPQYGCEMEILRFDSTAPSRKYGAHIRRMARSFLDLPVVCASPGWRHVALETRPRLLPSWASLTHRHVPCFAHRRLAPAPA